MDSAQASQKGAPKRIWGKVQEPEKSRLSAAEKRHGMTWNDLHGYKLLMQYPILPTQMGVDELSKDISLCDSWFRGLDRCLEEGMRTETKSQPYARMQICKPHWIRFLRCTKRRDELVMRDVKKWEHSYYSAMDEASGKEYLEDIDTKMRYFLYAASHTADAQKKKRLEMNAQHCAMRQMSLLQPRGSSVSTNE